MQIVIPTECPSCGSTLENVNGQLFCRNKTACPAQSSKLVENYCKKMKIKGFGSATVSKLELTTISGLYNLTEQRLTSVLGDKLGSKLFTEIQKTKTSDFALVLGSLGIKLIGKVAAGIAATKINSFQEITAKACTDAGLGVKATESLMDWCNSLEGLDTIEALDGFITFAEVSTKPTQNTEHKFDVCITGKLNDYASRSKAADYLSQFGITVKGSVTKTVKYLVCEDETKKGSSSYKKALANDLPIVTIKELINIIGE
ncbi:NAD-dependent DNA ligase [Vibrio phage Quinn]|uniref:NAD-dependent DNA ligase subunit B n=1 Tax=Vibrio phage Quinn TaxID=2736265 RepID=A0A6M9Z5D6_9CAUD|nr:NAD-dependent DNA ligase [Vibrio phage Quinn]QKN85299.1 NAD-dependent DNA ligase subunit B [Vibrio phage Quinn]